MHQPEPGAPVGEPERLHRFLARAGLGSRRSCEELVVQGRVSVNGTIIRELGTKVQPGADTIKVDGQQVRHERTVYFAVNKPKGYVSTNDDPAGRPRVVDLVAEVPERVYSVGRLDEDSTGLMLLTNDGDLANKLAHPKFGVEKVYRALVAGLPTREALDKLLEGVWLSDGKARAKRVRITGRRGEATMIEMVLAEGKNREVRRMLAKLGHKVMTLQRVAVGPVTLQGLKVGNYRHLTGREVDLLRRVAAGESVPTADYGDRDEFRMPRDSAPRRGPARYERRPAPQPARPSGRPGSEGPGQPRAGGPPRRPGLASGGARPGGPAPRRRDDESADQGRPPRPRRYDDAGPSGARRPGSKPPRPARYRDDQIEVGPMVEGLPLQPPPSRRGPAGRPGRPAGPAQSGPPRGPRRPAAGPGPRGVQTGNAGPAGRPGRPAGPAQSGPPRGPRRPAGGPVPRDVQTGGTGGPPARRIIGLETGGPSGEGPSHSARPPRPGAPARPARPGGPRVDGDRPPGRPKARPKPMRKPRRERPGSE